MVQGGGSLAGGTNRAWADGGWGSGTGEIRRGPIKMKPLPLRLVRVNPVYCVAMLLLKKKQWSGRMQEGNCLHVCLLVALVLQSD